jgi:hypothetical protein
VGLTLRATGDPAQAICETELSSFALAHPASPTATVGANRDFILNHIPHISKQKVGDIGAVLDHAQTVMIGTKDPDFTAVPSVCAKAKWWSILCGSLKAGVRMESRTAFAGERRETLPGLTARRDSSK